MANGGRLLRKKSREASCLCLVVVKRVEKEGGLASRLSKRCLHAGDALCDDTLMHRVSSTLCPQVVLLMSINSPGYSDIGLVALRRSRRGDAN